MKYDFSLCIYSHTHMDVCVCVYSHTHPHGCVCVYSHTHMNVCVRLLLPYHIKQKIRLGDIHQNTISNFLNQTSGGDAYTKVMLHTIHHHTVLFVTHMIPHTTSLAHVNLFQVLKRCPKTCRLTRIQTSDFILQHHLNPLLNLSNPWDLEEVTRFPHDLQNVNWKERNGLWYVH